MTIHEAVEILEEVKTLDDSMFAYSQAYNDALEMAIEALKAQEPRVLSYDEARNNAMQTMNPDSIKPLFIEFRVKDDEDDEVVHPPWRGGYNQRLMLMNPDRYGVEFRFWTDRPSVEQMEATPW